MAEEKKEEGGKRGFFLAGKGRKAHDDKEVTAPVEKETAVPEMEEPAAPAVEELAAPVMEEPSAFVPEKSAVSAVEELAAPVMEEREERVDITQSNEEYRRHDYMDLFSPSNPNVFGNNDEDRAFAEQTFSRESSNEPILREERDMEIREERNEFSTYDRAEESERGRGISLFDT